MWCVDAIDSIDTRVWLPIVEIIAAIGQSQLIRKLIALGCRNTSLWVPSHAPPSCGKTGLFGRLGAPVAFHRAMKLPSDFVEDKDAVFGSCPASPNQISCQMPSMVGDTAGDLSDSTLTGRADFLEDEAVTSCRKNALSRKTTLLITDYISQRIVHFDGTTVPEFCQPPHFLQHKPCEEPKPISERPKNGR